MHQHQVYLHTDTSTEGAKMLTMFTFQSNTHHQFEAAAHQITLTAKERKRRLCELAADKRNTLKDPEQLHAQGNKLGMQKTVSKVNITFCGNTINARQITYI